MFGRQRQPISPREPSSLPASLSSDLGVVFHVMPQGFLQSEASLPVSLEPVLAIPTPEPEKIKPNDGQQETPIDSPALPKKRRLMVMMLVLFLVLGGGIITYIFFFPSFTAPVTPSPTITTSPSPASSSPTISLTPLPSVSVVAVQGVDTDSDGLTNVEELLFGTNFRNPDTDGDSFLDGNEVFHRYDPNGSAPSTLLLTGVVRTHQFVQAPLVISYPATWRVGEINASSDTVSFMPGGAVTTVFYAQVYRQVAEQTLLSFLAVQRPEVLTEKYQAFTTKTGFEAVALGDARTVFVYLGTTVVMMTYDSGTDKTIEYLQTFKMMVNSLDLLQP